MIVLKASGEAASIFRRAVAMVLDFFLAMGFLTASMFWTAYRIRDNGIRIGSASNTLQFYCFVGSFFAFYLVFRLFTGRTPAMAILGLERRRADGRPSGWLHSWLASVLVLAAVVYVPGRLYFPPDPEQKLRAEAHAAFSQIAIALSYYYGDHDGRYPKTLDDAEFRKDYLPQIPPLDLGFPGQSPSDKVEIYSFGTPDHGILPEKLKNTGHWAYDPKTGSLAVDSDQLWKGEPAYFVGNQ